MNNEQTQANKLAEKIVDEVASGVLNHLMGVQVGTPRHLSIQRASELIVKAITQATAELREENERFENFGKIHAKAADHEILALRKKLSQAETERDQAQAQVAALVEEIEPFACQKNWGGGSKFTLDNSGDAIITTGYFHTFEGYKPWYKPQRLLLNLKATADAYTAKVRRDAIEECIRIAKVHTLGMDYERVKRLVEKLQSLLPEPAEKGGA